MSESKRVEFKLDAELHQQLRERLSVGGTTRRAFPKEFLATLMLPYILYYLRDPTITEKLITANLTSSLIDEEELQEALELL